jgi:hypothetical protein
VSKKSKDYSNEEDDDERGSGGGTGSSGSTGEIEGPVLFSLDEKSDLLDSKENQEIASKLAEQLVKDIRTEGRRRGHKYKQAKQMVGQNFNNANNLVANPGGGGTEQHPLLAHASGILPENIQTIPGVKNEDKSITSQHKNKNKLQNKYKISQPRLTNKPKYSPIPSPSTPKPRPF